MIASMTRTLVGVAVLVTAAALVAVPGVPRVVTAAPRLLVVNKAEATLAVIDVERMSVLGKVPTGNGPHEVTSDGTLAFVANYGTGPEPGNSVSVIDLATMTERNRIELGAHLRPHGIICRQGGVWITTESSRCVHRYDVASGRLDWANGTGQDLSHMVAVAPDAKKIYTANIASHSVTVFQRPQNALAPWKLTQVKVGQGPEGIDVSPDGREVWTAHRVDGGVSVIDAAGDSVLQTLTGVCKVPIRVKFTPDGRKVLITDVGSLQEPQPGQLVVLDAAQRKEIGRLQLGMGPIGIAPAPDSRRAFVAVVQEGKVVAIDLERMVVTGSVQTGEGPDGLWWVE
jgi:DNA-binding beta-propeller fold protein YncE